MPSVTRAINLMELLGLSESYRGYVEQYEALCIFTDGNGASPIELVVPSGGQLAKFNRGAGGLHHIAVEVEGIDAVTGELGRRGISLLESSPVRGAGDFLCNFLSPAYTGGVIVEFIETLPAGGARRGRHRGQRPPHSGRHDTHHLANRRLRTPEGKVNL